jgi:hypothetical protein
MEIAVVAAACCSLVALLAVATYMATRDGGGPVPERLTAGEVLRREYNTSKIPTSMPVPKTPLIAQMIKYLWAIDTNCTAVLVWARREASDSLMKVDREVVEKRVAAKDVERYVNEWMLEDDWWWGFVVVVYREVHMTSLGAKAPFCSDDAYIRWPGKKSSLRIVDTFRRLEVNRDFWSGGMAGTSGLERRLAVMT